MYIHSWRIVDNFNEGSDMCSTCDMEKTIIIFKQNIYANSDSGLLFIMCGHCSPAVVWYNYHGTLT